MPNSLFSHIPKGMSKLGNLSSVYTSIHALTASKTKLGTENPFFLHLSYRVAQWCISINILYKFLNVRLPHESYTLALHDNVVFCRQNIFETFKKFSWKLPQRGNTIQLFWKPKFTFRTLRGHIFLFWSVHSVQVTSLQSALNRSDWLSNFYRYSYWTFDVEEELQM